MQVKSSWGVKFDSFCEFWTVFHFHVDQNRQWRATCMKVFPQSEHFWSTGCVKGIIPLYTCSLVDCRDKKCISWHLFISLFVLSLSLSLSEPSQEAWGRAFLGHSPLPSGVCPGTCRHRQDQNSGQDPTYSCTGWGGRGDHTADWSDLCPWGGHPRADQDGEGGGLKGWVFFFTFAWS